MKKERLSVIIIAKDEEENIKDCLESVKWADEIVVVVDDRTTDRTAEIVKKYTDKVFRHRFEGFGKQYQFALEKTTGEWVLKIDADERVTPELKREILKKIKTDKYDGYHAYFQVVFLEEPFRPIAKKFQGTIRLALRRKAKFTLVPIHERMIVGGKIGVLENRILHHSHKTITQALDKFNYYSTLEAEELFDKGGRTNLLKMILAPLNIFFKEFFLLGNYRNGMHGLVYALLYADFYLMKHLKIWELQEKNRKI